MGNREQREIRKEMEKDARGKKESFTCKNCSRSFKIPVATVLSGGQQTCPHCNNAQDIKGDGDRASKELADFKKHLKKRFG